MGRNHHEPRRLGGVLDLHASGEWRSGAGDPVAARPRLGWNRLLTQAHDELISALGWSTERRRCAGVLLSGFHEGAARDRINRQQLRVTLNSASVLPKRQQLAPCAPNRSLGCRHDADMRRSGNLTSPLSLRPNGRPVESEFFTHLQATAQARRLNDMKSLTLCFRARNVHHFCRKPFGLITQAR